MGIGGHLMWTPLAREIKKHTGKTVFPYEQFVDGRRALGSGIFKGNPNFSSNRENSVDVCFNDPATNYCKFDAPDRCVQRHDKHVIHQICEAYGFQNVELKCELYLTEEELLKNDAFKGWIVIDPNTKDEYTVNKRYPFAKWQRVVDALVADGHRVVQVGQKTKIILSGVMDCTGKTSFREAAAIIKHARLFVGSEGGLMHAANAVGTPAVILVTGFLHPRMTCYPENRNIWIGSSHGPCGMKVRCEKCFTECVKHDESEIIAATKEMLS